MSDKLKTRSAYIVYVRGQGYMKNKAGEFHKDFEHARLFTTEKSESDSIDMNKRLRKLSKDSQAFVIPVEMTLDPRKLFKTILSSE